MLNEENDENFVLVPLTGLDDTEVLIGALSLV